MYEKHPADNMKSEPTLGSTSRPMKISRLTNLLDSRPVGSQNKMDGQIIPITNGEWPQVALETYSSPRAVNGKSKGKAIMVESSGSPRVYVRKFFGICIHEPQEGWRCPTPSGLIRIHEHI
ncbi:unnamed protein product [Linum trigynum]|uniref:Uncharacterized protein n=1 Tax=Linum trigynum TaxID=586398 RepID=A0AAV2D9A4_9ROSI